MIQFRFILHYPNCCDFYCPVCMKRSKTTKVATYIREKSMFKPLINPEKNNLLILWLLHINSAATLSATAALLLISGCCQGQNMQKVKDSSFHQNDLTHLNPQKHTKTWINNCGRNCYKQKYLLVGSIILSSGVHCWQVALQPQAWHRDGFFTLAFTPTANFWVINNLTCMHLDCCRSGIIRISFLQWKCYFWRIKCSYIHFSLHTLKASVHEWSSW